MRAIVDCVEIAFGSAIRAIVDCVESRLTAEIAGDDGEIAVIVLWTAESRTSEGTAQGTTVATAASGPCVDFGEGCAGL